MGTSMPFAPLQKSDVKLRAPCAASPGTGGSAAALWFRCGRAHFHFHVAHPRFGQGTLHPKDIARTRITPQRGISSAFVLTAPETRESRGVNALNALSWVTTEGSKSWEAGDGSGTRLLQGRVLSSWGGIAG